MCSGHHLNLQGCLRKGQKEISRSSLRWWSLNCTSNHLPACRFRFQKNGTPFSHMQCSCLHQIIYICNKAIGSDFAPKSRFFGLKQGSRKVRALCAVNVLNNRLQCKLTDLSIVYHSLNLSGFSAATSSNSCLRCGCSKYCMDSLKLFTWAKCHLLSGLQKVARGM